jgi:LmbE family N-acetylglucosaminyl deacetylase
MEVPMIPSPTLFRVLAVAAATLIPGSVPAAAADGPLRIIVFGAHPDDCDLDAGGTAALWAAKGHQVKFVALTNGDAGHQSEGGGALAKKRRAEAQEAGRRLGIAEYEVLDNHDGELEPTLAVRQQVIRRIRQWNADVVIAPRPNDYHPDHRYTGVVVQDSAYMVVVPNVTPDTPPLRKNPVFLYSADHFQRPNPFRPDVAVAIDSVIDRKIAALDAHESQVYEWLPWVDGQLDGVPKDKAARVAWLKAQRAGQKLGPDTKEALRKWYGAKADAVQNVEAFEVCEYGRRPTEADLRRLFPFFD